MTCTCISDCVLSLLMDLENQDVAAVYDEYICLCTQCTVFSVIIIHILETVFLSTYCNIQRYFQVHRCTLLCCYFKSESGEIFIF